MANEDFTTTQIEMLSRRWREDPSPHLSLQLADLYRQSGRIGEALPILEEGLESYPDSVSVRVALGRYLMESGDPEEAAEALREVVDSDPGHLVANKLLVRAHLALGEFQSATDRLDLYAVLNDSDPELESLRAAVSGRSRLPPLGASTAAGASPFESSPLPPASDLRSLPPPTNGRMLVGALDREPFTDVLESMAVSSVFTGVFAGLAELFETPKRIERIAADVVADLAVEPESAVEANEPALDSVIDVEVGLDEEPTAAADAEEAEPVDELEGREQEAPRAVDTGAAATATLGALYLAQGHFDEAEETFRQVLERDPDDLEASSGLAEIEARRSGHEAEPDVGEEKAASQKVAVLREYLAKFRAAAQRLA